MRYFPDDVIKINQHIECKSKICHQEQKEQNGYDQHGPTNSSPEIPSFVIEEEPSKTISDVPSPAWPEAWGLGLAKGSLGL